MGGADAPKEEGLKLPDHYAALGISADSTTDQIKLSFRELARRHHPDRGGDADSFHRIREAYELLSNPAEREKYDLARKVLLSLRCECGEAKLPGAGRCAWCGLRAAQVHHEAESRDKAERRRKAVSDAVDKLWLPKSAAPPKQERASRPPPKADSGPRAAPAPERASPQERRTRGIDLPSADDILVSVLSEVAAKAGILDAGLELDVRVQADPLTGQVRFSGRSVDAVRNMQRNLDMVRDVTGILRRYSSGG